MVAMINGNSCVLCQLVMISLQSQGSRSRHWQTGQPKCQGHLIPPEPLPSVTIDKFSVGSNNNCFEEEIERRQRWLFLKKKQIATSEWIAPKFGGRWTACRCLPTCPPMPPPVPSRPPSKLQPGPSLLLLFPTIFEIVFWRSFWSS